MRSGPNCSDPSRIATTRCRCFPAGTSGQAAGRQAQSRDALVSDIKKQLQSEMGLLPVELLRSRRQSFVELYAYDNLGKTNYGTAGYLGQRLLHHREARRHRAAR